MVVPKAVPAIARCLQYPGWVGGGSGSDNSAIGTVMRTEHIRAAT